MRSSARIAVGALLVLLATRGFAWQWPVPSPEITGMLGQNAGGYLLRGAEFSGGAQPVYPIENGIVIAAHPARPDLPTGLGSYVVVDHEQAFRSIYAHLEADALPHVGTAVDTDTPIGVVGGSGQVRGVTFRLYIIDLRTGSYVNPMLLLPDLPDETPPTIADIVARDEESFYDLGQATRLPPGTYEITALIYDRLSPGAAATRVAPYSIRTFVGGQEAMAVTMDEIVVEPDGSRVEPGSLLLSELYGEDGYLKLGTVTVSSRETQFEVVAVDFAGNERSWSISLAAIASPEVPARDR